MTTVELLLARLRSPRHIKDPEAMLEKLDELVHDEFSRKASSLNNQGVDDQVEFLCQHNTPDEVEKLLEPFLRTNEDSDEHDDKPPV